MNSERGGFDPTRESIVKRTETAIVSEHLSEAHRQMYDIPGVEPVTEADRKQYERSRGLLESAIDDRMKKGIHSDQSDVRGDALVSILLRGSSEEFCREAVHIGLHDSSEVNRMLAVDSISLLPESERALFIELAMQDPFLEVCLTAVKKIVTVSSSDQKRLLTFLPGLLNKVLENEYPISLKEYNFLITLLPEQERVQFLSSVLERDVIAPICQLISNVVELSPEHDALKQAYFHAIEERISYVYDNDLSDVISAVPEEEKKKIVKKMSKLSLSNKRKMALHFSEYLTEQERDQLISECLLSRDVSLNEEAVKVFSLASNKEQKRLWDQALDSPQTAIRVLALQTAFSFMRSSSINFQDSFALILEKAFHDPDESVRREAIFGIPFLPEEERLRYVQKALKDSDVRVCLRAAERIDSLAEVEQNALRKEVAIKIDELLHSKDISVQESSMHFIPYAPIDQQESLIKRALEVNPSIVRLQAKHLFSNLSDEVRAKIEMQLGLNQPPTQEELEKLKEFASSTPLYNRAPDSFFRADFQKTGSRTTLLGSREVDAQAEQDRSLKGRVIIRHIPYYAYQIWRNAFERSDFWKEEGFDYVPIEPILRVRPDQKKPSDVAVFSRVLGPSVNMWFGKTSLFKKEITEQMDRITASLETLGVKHGHLHTDNFCLAFYKEADGSIDLTQPPNVYAIDFDQATSSWKPTSPVG